MILQLKNVNVYQRELLILSDVNLEIKRGEFVYLIGKTGSGKSSLLKILYGDIQLKEGTGHVVGFDLKKIRQKNIPHLRRKLGIVFQDFQLLSDRTVNENLIFALKATGWKDRRQIQQQVMKVLSYVGLESKGLKFPHQLSGGEQQRIAVARALLNDPELILADEPTGNLDPETTQEILMLLYEISKTGTSIIMATHDYAHMKSISSRVVQCEEGKIVEWRRETTV